MLHTSNCNGAISTSTAFAPKTTAKRIGDDPHWLGGGGYESQISPYIIPPPASQDTLFSNNVTLWDPKVLDRNFVKTKSFPGAASSSSLLGLKKGSPANNVHVLKRAFASRICHTTIKTKRLCASFHSYKRISNKNRNGHLLSNHKQQKTSSTLQTTKNNV